MEEQTPIKFRDSIDVLSAGMGMHIALRNGAQISIEVRRLLEANEYFTNRSKQRPLRWEKVRKFINNRNA